MAMLLLSYKARIELSRLTSEPRNLTSMTPCLLGCPLMIIRIMRTVHLLTLGGIYLFKVSLALQIFSQNT